MSCSIIDTILSIYPAQPTVQNQEIHEVTYSLKVELFSVPNRNLLITLPTGKCWHAKFQNERENRDTIWARKRREHVSCHAVWVRCKFVPSVLDRGYSQDRNIKEERRKKFSWKLITRFAQAAFSLYIWDSASLCQMTKPHPDDDVKQKIWRRYRINHLAEVQTQRLAQMGAKSYICLLTSDDCVNGYVWLFFPFVNFYRIKTGSVLEEPT